MDFIELKKVANFNQNKRITKRYTAFEKLITELTRKELPIEIVNSINTEIKTINAFTEPDKALSKQLRKSTSDILKMLEKKLKLVPKNLYRARWMAIGMSMGVAIGAAFGASMGNSGSIAIGIGVGMTLGLVIGSGMDKKAKEEGRQLEFEVKY